MAALALPAAGLAEEQLASAVLETVLLVLGVMTLLALHVTWTPTAILTLLIADMSFQGC